MREAKYEGEPIAGSHRGPLLSMKELGLMLGTGQTKTFEIVASGAIASAKFGRKRMAFRDSVDAYIEAARPKTMEAASVMTSIPMSPPPRGSAAGLGSVSAWPARDNPSSTATPTDLQLQFVARRFRLNAAVAAVVAQHVFGGAR